MSGTTQQTGIDQLGRAISNALRKQAATGSAYSSGGAGPGAQQQQQAYSDQGQAWGDDGGDSGGSDG